MSEANKLNRKGQGKIEVWLKWPAWRKAVAGSIAGNAIALPIVLLAGGSYWWFLAVPVAALILVATPSGFLNQ